MSVFSVQRNKSVCHVQTFIKCSRVDSVLPVPGVKPLPPPSDVLVGIRSNTTVILATSPQEKDHGATLSRNRTSHVTERHDSHPVRAAVNNRCRFTASSRFKASNDGVPGFRQLCTRRAACIPARHIVFFLRKKVGRMRSNHKRPGMDQGGHERRAGARRSCFSERVLCRLERLPDESPVVSLSPGSRSSRCSRLKSAHVYSCRARPPFGPSFAKPCAIQSQFCEKEQQPFSNKTRPSVGCRQ